MKNLRPFELERYFAKYEFEAEHLLSCSDCEALSLSELLQWARPGTLSLWENLKLGYTETLGHPLLRERLSEMYEGLSLENILVSVPQECIFLFMNTVLAPGDHVICTSPAYQSLHEVARSIGCPITLWGPDEERAWHFDLQTLKKEIREDTKLVVVNFPHNPTGYIPPKVEFQGLVDILEARGIYLFSDEMYRYLEVDKGATLDPACDLYDRAFSMSGLSKAFGLPGLRIGWVATKEKEILTRMSFLKDYTTICNSAPAEILGLMALENRDKILDRQLRRIHRNVRVLDEFFRKHGDYLTWNRPRGASVCFPRLSANKDSYEFCEQVVRDCGIMLAPSRMFGYGDRHVRIGFGREDLPRVLQIFGEYLEKKGCS